MSEKPPGCIDCGITWDEIHSMQPAVGSNLNTIILTLYFGTPCIYSLRVLCILNICKLYTNMYVNIYIYIYIYINQIYIYIYTHINIAIHNKNLWKNENSIKKGEFWQKCKFEKSSKFPKTAKMDKMQNSNFGGFEQKRLKKVCACIISKLSYCTLNGRQFVGMFTTYIKEIPIFLNIQHKKPPNAIFSRY